VKFLYPLLVVLLAVFAVAPLEYPGAFESHTGLLATYNLINLDQNPAQFFNWAPTVGRAYDLFRSDGALPYIVAEIFHLIGFGYLDAIKLVYALAWIASGLTMYALARKWLNEASALLAATVYVYLPYHIATIYVRGAFVESVAWALFPLALLAVASQQSTVNSILRFTFYVLPFAFLFLIQPGIAILFALTALAITAALHWRIGSLAHWLIGSLVAISGLALGALLYMPTVLRYGASIAHDGFAASFIQPFQLFSSMWGFGTSTGSYLDKFPFQLGVVPIGLATIAVALAWRAAPAVEHLPLRAVHGSNSTANSGGSRLEADLNLPEAVASSDQRTNARRATAVFLAVAIGLTLLTFEIAAPLWNVLGIFVAYPWQLLAFVGLALALIAGAAIEFDPRLSRPAMLAVFVALPVIASYGYLAPRFLDVTPTRPQIAVFGNNEIALLDYRIVGPLRHGATVGLQLTWQALRPVDHDYTVFVHAVHEDGKTYAQEDAKPQDGALPTIKWTPGQVIADTHTIQIDVDGPREGYHLEFGLYVAATGERATTDTGADHLILPRPGDSEPTITDQLPPTNSQ
jgi:hypothetical protein